MAAEEPHENKFGILGRSKFEERARAGAEEARGPARGGGEAYVMMTLPLLSRKKIAEIVIENEENNYKEGQGERCSTETGESDRED